MALRSYAASLVHLLVRRFLSMLTCMHAFVGGCVHVPLQVLPRLEPNCKNTMLLESYMGPAVLAPQDVV